MQLNIGHTDDLMVLMLNETRLLLQIFQAAMKRLS